jgi:hypothetical protein
MPRPKTEAAQYARLTLRVPQEMATALRLAAHHAQRPLNTQAIMVLRRGLQQTRSAVRGTAEDARRLAPPRGEDLLPGAASGVL